MFCLLQNLFYLWNILISDFLLNIIEYGQQSQYFGLPWDLLAEIDFFYFKLFFDILLEKKVGTIFPRQLGLLEAILNIIIRNT